MNRLRTLFVLVGFGLMAFLSIGCPYDGPHYPTTYGVPTATPTQAPLTAAVTALISSTFNPASVTIFRGGAVTFVLGAGTHSVYIDNGSGVCGTNYTLFPSTVPFPTAGTYNFHCQYHSPCALTTCNATCTGMVGTVVVQ